MLKMYRKIMKKVVLKVNLEVERGTKTAFVGQNGQGSRPGKNYCQRN